MKKRINIFMALLLCMAIMMGNVAYANEQEEQDDIDARTMVVYNLETGEVTYDVVDEEEMMEKVANYRLSVETAKMTSQETAQNQPELNSPQLIDMSRMNESPYNAIGRVDTEFSGTKDKEKHGTGTMLPGNLVLTSAHVVYDIEDGRGFAINTLFKPHFTVGNMTGGKKPKHVIVPLKFTRDHDDAYDYAMLAFDNDLGIGCLGLAFSGDYSTHDGRILHMLGYQPEKDMGMYSQYGKILSSDYSYLYSGMKTENGWSGGPLLEDDTYVIGVLKGRWFTRARIVRITEEIFNMIVSYM